MRAGGRAARVVAVVAVVAVAGCRRNLEAPAPDASTAIVLHDAAAIDAVLALDLTARDGADDPPFAIGIPSADPDAGSCRPTPGEETGVVCFGADPAPYQRYLRPDDGGVVPGQCPTTRDFMPVGGERCGYVSCGPLLGSAVAGLPDASAAIGDAGTACCFLVSYVCGV